jgi:VIT1/CCC1 family predicted Fe2+/Mn2+ transporter
MTTATANVIKLPIVDQVKTAMKPQNRLATGAGFVLGGFVPVASFVLAHTEVRAEQPLWAQMPALLVLAGLVYSAKTVFDWARIAFKHPAKALGFVVLTEGVMTFSHTAALSFAALFILITINGIATGCNLALDVKAAKGKK